MKRRMYLWTFFSLLIWGSKIVFGNLHWQEHLAKIYLDELREESDYFPKMSLCSTKEDLTLIGDSIKNPNRYRCLVQLVLSTLRASTKKDYLETYNGVLKNIRLAVTTQYYEFNRHERAKIEIKALQKICFKLYSGMKTSSFKFDLVEKLLGSSRFTPYPKTVTGEDFDKQKRLELLENQISLIPHFSEILEERSDNLQIPAHIRVKKKIAGNTHFLRFDPNTMGSFPSRKFSLINKKDQKVFVLRMSTPTTEKWRNVEVVGEFLAYKDYLLNHDLSHAYFSFQDNRNYKALFDENETFRLLGIGFEEHRSKVLEAFFDKNSRKSFQFFNFSKNNLFYKQSKSFEQKLDKQTFLKHLLKQYFNTSSLGYKLPSDEHGLEGDLVKLFQIFFENQSDLSNKDKENFVELSYVMMILKMAQSFDFINTSCKDDIDRGACVKALMYIVQTTFDVIFDRLSADEFKERLDNLNQVVFSDALTTSWRSLIPKYLQRAVQASLWFVDFCKNHPEVYNQLELFDHYKRLDLEKHHNSKSQEISDAFILEKMVKDL